MTTRLPTPGGDDGQWGQILNDFLAQAHNSDGSLKPLDQSQIKDLVNSLAAKLNITDAAPVATTGNYNDLANKPVIPATAADVGAVSVTGLDAATAGLVNNTSSTTTGALKAAFEARNLPSYAATNLPRPNCFDPARSVYNWKLSNTKHFRAKLGKALAGTDVVRIINPGDSAMAGYGATYGATDWTVQLRKLLAGRGYPIASAGWIWLTHNTADFDARVSFTGTWTSAGGGPSWNWRGTSVAGSSVTVTTDLPGDTIDILAFSGSTTSPAHVTIDGVAQADFTPAVAATPAPQIATYSGLANTTHVVTITAPTPVPTGTVVDPVAVRCRKASATGIEITNLAISGSLSGSWTNHYTDYGPWPVSLFTQPDLILFDPWGNDAIQGIPVATTKANLIKLIDRAKAVTPNADIVLVSIYGLDETYSGGGPVITEAYLAQFRSMHYDLADQYDIPLVDLRALLGSWADNNALGLMFDHLHPNVNGQALEAQFWANLLTSP